ncbi:hypothetical protein JD844_006062 [Phrynosoma platyrhinos]|uniref:WH1 domain-containing protein n=1 Tax=Phrynosoma platyrhinos TaxID=52577 RepID=A0ABQ7TP96_PHRPL|nr:hypothetical protein JD844_006062 [Phrynosoma platyrhinos]
MDLLPFGRITLGKPKAPVPDPPKKTEVKQVEKSSESVLCTTRATVMLYDDANKKWVPAGSGPQVFSRIQIYHSPANNTNTTDILIRQQMPVILVSLLIVSVQTFMPSSKCMHIGNLAPVRPVQNGPSADEMEQQKRQQLEREQHEQAERERKVTIAAGTDGRSGKGRHLQPLLQEEVLPHPQDHHQPPHARLPDLRGHPPACQRDPQGHLHLRGLLHPPDPHQAFHPREGGHPQRHPSLLPKVPLEVPDPQPVWLQPLQEQNSRRLARMVSFSVPQEEGPKAASAGAAAPSAPGGGGLMEEMSAMLARRRKVAEQSEKTIPKKEEGLTQQDDGEAAGAKTTGRMKSAGAITGSEPAGGGGDESELERVKQELLQEVRRELQKVKEEIIQGSVFTYLGRGQSIQQLRVTGRVKGPLHPKSYCTR